jgi:hypothetical protein
MKRWLWVTGVALTSWVLATMADHDEADAIPRVLAPAASKSATTATVPAAASPNAAEAVRPPECGYLDTLKLPTGKYWNPDPSFGRHRCVSDYRPLHSRDGRQNLMTYLAEGNELGAIDSFTLTLDVSVKPYEREARRELVLAADLLCGNAIGERLPKAAEKAILAGGTVKMTKNQATISVMRSDWSTGIGYDIKVRLARDGAR